PCRVVAKIRSPEGVRLRIEGPAGLPVGPSGLQAGIIRIGVARGCAVSVVIMVPVSAEPVVDGSPQRLLQLKCHPRLGGNIYILAACEDLSAGARSGSCTR